MWVSNITIIWYLLDYFVSYLQVNTGRGHACTLGYVLPWEQILGCVLFVLDLHAEMGYFVAR